MSAVIVAGLDVATTTGLAVVAGDRLLHWEAHRPAGKLNAEIFFGFRAWLMMMLTRYQPKYVGVEEPLRTDLRRTNRDGTTEPLSTMQTYLRLYGLHAHAIEICFRQGIACEPHIHQATWRKSFLGSGRPGGDVKEAALRQCRLLGWNITSKDAAEAAGVAFHTQGLLRQDRAGELFAGAAA